MSNKGLDSFAYIGHKDIAVCRLDGFVFGGHRGEDQRLGIRNGEYFMSRCRIPHRFRGLLLGAALLASVPTGGVVAMEVHRGSDGQPLLDAPTVPAADAPSPSEASSGEEEGGQRPAFQPAPGGGEMVILDGRFDRRSVALPGGRIGCSPAPQ